VQTGLDVLLTALAVPVAAAAVYQVVIAVAAFFYAGSTGGRQRGRPSTRLAVLVPAHDEAALIARCVSSLKKQTYPADLFDVVVIADNCSDETAAIARSNGADVLVRVDLDRPGKGRALRWAIDKLLSGRRPPDAVVIVDADSVADPGLLAALVRPFETGARVVQGESLLSEDGSPQSALRAAAFLLVNHVRPSGRAVLGLPSNLAGNGMLLGRAVLETNPWDAYTSAEDVEYSVGLRMAGIRVVFGAGAILRTPTPPNARAAEQQRLRWEGGKLHLAYRRCPRLVWHAIRERRPLLVDAAVELALPPLGLLTAAAVLGAVLAAVLAWLGLVGASAVVPWLVAVGAIPLYVLLGFRAGHAPRSAYRALLRAPLFVVTKTVRSYRLIAFRSDTWVRTQRAE